MTGGPGKEHGTNKPPPVEEFGKGQKETSHVRPPPRILSGIHLGWTRRAPPGSTLSQNDWLKTTRKLIPIAIKPETASQVAELFSWVPLPYCSPPGCPFLIKSLALSAHVPPWTIHFWVLDKSPVWVLEGDPFLQQMHYRMFSACAIRGIKIHYFLSSLMSQYK